MSGGRRGKAGVNAAQTGDGLQSSARYQRHKQAIVQALQVMVTQLENDQWDRVIELCTIAINHAAALLMIPDEA